MSEELDKSIAHSLGSISGQLQVMQTNFSENLKIIRDDIKRMDDNNKQNLLHLEERINSKISSVDTRVKVLETAEKENIKVNAKHGLGFTCAGAVLGWGFIELLKRFH